MIEYHINSNNQFILSKVKFSLIVTVSVLIKKHHQTMMMVLDENNDSLMNEFLMRTMTV